MTLYFEGNELVVPGVGLLWQPGSSESVALPAVRTRRFLSTRLRWYFTAELKPSSPFEDVRGRPEEAVPQSQSGKAAATTTACYEEVFEKLPLLLPALLAMFSSVPANVAI